jgi:hypothetical protein
MRSKVVLIKGWAGAAPRITISAHERVNADYIVMMAAMRYPQLLPDEYSGFETDLTTLYHRTKEVLDHWNLTEQQHILAAEYANVVVDRGQHSVKAVEGDSLEVDWYYDTVRNYHRHFGQTVVDCEFVYIPDRKFIHDKDCKFMKIDGKMHPLEEAIEILQPHQTLG